MALKLMHIDLKPKKLILISLCLQPQTFNHKLNCCIIKCVYVDLGGHGKPKLSNPVLAVSKNDDRPHGSDRWSAFYRFIRFEAQRYTALVYDKAFVSNCSHYSLRSVSLSND